MNSDQPKETAPRKESWDKKLIRWTVLRIPGLNEQERRDVLDRLDNPPTGPIRWVGQGLDRLLVIFGLTGLAFIGLKLARVAPFLHWSWLEVCRPLWEFFPVTVVMGLLLLYVLDALELH